MDIHNKDYCNDANSIEINKTIPVENTFYTLAELFKVFGDSTRLKILFALLKNEMCVQHIALALSMTQSAVSHQLRVLKAAKLVKFRKEGKTIIYSLDDSHVETMFKQGLEHINHQNFNEEQGGK